MTTEDSCNACRIAWLVQGNEGFGVARAVEALTGEMHRLGHETLIVALGDGPFADTCEARGRKVLRLHVGKAPALSGGLARKVRQCIRLRRYERRVESALSDAIHTLRVDALHFLWPNLVGLAGAAAKQAGVPCLWEMPNIVSDRLPLGINRRIYQFQCWRYGIQPLANSAYTARSLGDWLVEPVVFHLGADTRVFDPEAVVPVPRGELGLPRDAVVLGVVARLNASKGQDRLLTAMMRLVKRGADLHLLLLGGPTDSPYANALRQVGGDRIHLIGTVGDPQRYYEVMDLAVNCYVDVESFGLSVIEAMMMGKPVLVHALGGPAETVVDDVTGWHVPFATVGALEAGLVQALADRSRWVEMGTAARRRALEQFSTQAQGRRYLAVLERVR